MRKILIPLDFSENAMNAIKYALEFFKYETSEFYFIHTYEDEVYNEKEKKLNESFENVLDEVSKKSKNINMEMRKTPTSLSKDGLKIRAVGDTSSGRGLKIRSIKKS